MNERRRPHRRGRGPRPSRPDANGDVTEDTNPYRDAGDTSAADGSADDGAPRARLEHDDDGDGARERSRDDAPRTETAVTPTESTAIATVVAPDGPPGERTDRPERPDRGDRPPRGDRPQRGRGPRGDRGPRGNREGGNRSEAARDDDRGNRNEEFRGNRRNRRNRRGRQRPGEPQERPPQAPVSVDGDTQGWFDAGRDGGYIRRHQFSYLPEAGDAFVPQQIVRQLGLRRGDAVQATVGRDPRGRVIVADVQTINGVDPQAALRRPDFGSLTAAYPDRKLFLETGRPAKGGPELTRRAIDLIAPIGYGQRALIVAPARAGKTMLMQAITEGIAINHPAATLLILLVDERPEEVSEAISWGVGEVVASSFDMPAERHTNVVEMVLERARRLVELGQDVVIVLDSLTRMARAYNTVERGTGRTLSGGLDAQAMAKPKAFFGSARAVAPAAGGGSLTIIATALVETGSRMDDVIFEEFKGTGNSEIKLDRSLADRRIFPAFDVATSGTRREEKLFRPDQLDAVHTLRRGLHQMPPQAAMEWLIKRIANTASNDALLAGL